MWHWSFLDWPTGETAYYGVLIGLEELREDRLNLLDEIPASVAQELGERLDKFVARYGEMADAVAGDLDEQALLPEPGWTERYDGFWKELCIVADRSIGERNRLRPWYDLGAALGKLTYRNYRARADLGVDSFMSEFREIVRSARAIPSEQSSLIPLLQSFLRLAGSSKGRGLRPFSAVCAWFTLTRRTRVTRGTTAECSSTTCYDGFIARSLEHPLRFGRPRPSRRAEILGSTTSRGIRLNREETKLFIICVSKEKDQVILLNILTILV
jgi:hypothetical protein